VGAVFFFVCVEEKWLWRVYVQRCYNQWGGSGHNNNNNNNAVEEQQQQWGGRRGQQQGQVVVLLYLMGLLSAVHELLAAMAQQLQQEDGVTMDHRVLFCAKPLLLVAPEEITRRLLQEHNIVVQVKNSIVQFPL
jgi:hypothetical protein